ncbi:MAG: CAP domain-containing protein [Hasllibacter sp.]
MRHGSLLAAAGAAVLALAGCAGPGGDPAAGGAYVLAAQPEGQVQFAMLDEVNALRAAAGAPALSLDAALNAAALTHSRDMSRQNRPWHFSSDGSSPLDRARRAGYAGGFLGEVIAESFETERETVAAWMAEAGPRGVLLNPAARQAGIGWFQEPGGKIWWTLVTGAPRAAAGALPPAPGIAAPLPPAGGSGGGAIALPRG